jgi:hypothetical protein
MPESIREAVILLKLMLDERSALRAMRDLVGTLARGAGVSIGSTLSVRQVIAPGLERDVLSARSAGGAASPRLHHAATDSGKTARGRDDSLAAHRADARPGRSQPPHPADFRHVEQQAVERPRFPASGRLPDPLAGRFDRSTRFVDSVFQPRIDRLEVHNEITVPLDPERLSREIESTLVPRIEEFTQKAVRRVLDQIEKADFARRANQPAF